MLFITLITLLSMAMPAKNQEKEIAIHFSKNIELLGYLIHLGDPTENDPEHPITRELNSYPQDRSNPALHELFSLAGDIPYSTLVDLMYNLPEFPLPEHYKVSDTLLSRYSETQEMKERLQSIVLLLDQFAVNSGFEKLWTRLHPYRLQTAKLLREQAPSAQLIAQMEMYYQHHFTTYEIVPSLTLWPGPGWGFKTGNNQTATFILGPLAKDFDYSNADKFHNLAVHEFGHAFANTPILESGGKLIHATESLFPPLEERMHEQGYTTWEACLTEHFVRAGEIIVSELMGDSKNRDSLMKNYTSERQFIYLPFMVERIKAYRLGKQLSFREAVRQTLTDMHENMEELLP